jgi:hypothetical protein
LANRNNFNCKKEMRNSIAIFVVLLGALAQWLAAQENLSSRIVRLPLNQNEPSVIKLGTRGITTIEFPSKIEALDGFGFNVNPAPDGPDLFQISFNKGTNFLSLKAMKEGVEGNLTVVLDGKVYSLFCKSVDDPVFVVIFEGGNGRRTTNPDEVLAKNKPISPARLLGFLDKVKAFPTLKVSAPEIFHGMDVAEPNSDSSLEGLQVLLRRVIRDDSIDAVGFEVELDNKTNKDFLYDPESFGVRAGSEVYQQAVADASGLVPAGKSQSAFFVVTGTATGGRNDLAVTNKFDVVMRQVQGDADPHRKVSTEWQEPPNAIPVSTTGYQEPPLPDSKDNRDQPKPATRRGRSRKHHARPTADPAAGREQQAKKGDTVAQHG